MKSFFVILSLAFFLLGSFAMVHASSGAIWTTKNDCGNVSQDVNHYSIGDKIFINGANFSPGLKNWTITGQPGGASCDPSVVVASGSYTVDSSGNFCIEAYTVKNDDCGEYKADFNGKNDNYRVNISAPTVPEFGATAGLITILGSLGLFFVVRRK